MLRTKMSLQPAFFRDTVVRDTECAVCSSGWKGAPLFAVTAFWDTDIVPVLCFVVCACEIFCLQNIGHG